jgi:hypothetical protein
MKIEGYIKVDRTASPMIGGSRPAQSPGGLQGIRWLLLRTTCLADRGVGRQRGPTIVEGLSHLLFLVALDTRKSFTT